MTDAEPFPLDFDALKKGDVIAKEKVSEYVGVPLNDRRYPIAALQFASRVKREMAERGEHVIVTNENDNLRILTDEESVGYCERTVRLHRRGMIRRHADLLTVDRSALTSETARTLDRLVIVQAAEIAAMRDARKALMLKPSEPNGSD